MPRRRSWIRWTKVDKAPTQGAGSASAATMRRCGGTGASDRPGLEIFCPIYLQTNFRLKWGSRDFGGFVVSIPGWEQVYSLWRIQNPPESFSSYFLTTWLPSAGSSNFQLHWMPCFPKRDIILCAISSKLLVASARIVGPAPDKHTPSRPGCVPGVIDSTISVSPGISVCRYGWCSLSCIAR